MLQFLQKLVETPELLKQGDKLLMDKLSDPANRQSTLYLISCKQYKFAPVLIQNVYKSLWELPEGQSGITASEKQITRNLLLETLLQCKDNLHYMESLVVFISKLHSVAGQGYQFWQYQRLLAEAESNFEYVLEVLLFLYRESDSSIRSVTEFVMPFLISNLQKILADKSPSALPANTAQLVQKILILNFGLVRSFSVFEGSDDQAVRRCFSSTCNAWFQKYAQLLTEGTQSQQKLVLKILTIVYGDLQKSTQHTLKVMVPLIWIYFNKMVPVYLVENVNDSCQHAGKMNNKLEQKYLNEVEFEPNTSSEAIIFQALELVECLFTRSSFQTLNNFAYYPLLNVLFTLLEAQCVQEKQWCSDPNKFLADLEDEHSPSIRNRILSFFLLLNSQMQGDQTTSPILSILKVLIVGAFNEANQQNLKSTFQELMMEKGVHKLVSDSSEVFGLGLNQLAVIYNSAFHSISQQVWKRKEVALLLLYNFGEQLMPVLDRASVFPILQAQLKEYNTYPLLSMQALHTISKSLEILEDKDLQRLFEYVRQALGGVLGIRLIAVKVLGILCRHLRNKSRNTVPLNQQIIGEVVQIVQKFDKQTAHIFLEACLQFAKFNPPTCLLIASRLQAVAPKLILQLYQDGLLFSILLDLFAICYTPSLQNWVVSTLQSKYFDKQVSELCVLCYRLLTTYLKNSGLDPKVVSPSRMLSLAKKVVAQEDAEPLLKQYLKVYEIDSQLLLKLKTIVKKSWVVPLQNRGYGNQISMEAVLLESVNKCLEVSSQFELENQLTLVLYFLYKDPKSVTAILKAQGLWRPFLEKWLRYQYLFVGSCLRKCTCYLLNILVEEYEDLKSTYIKYIAEKKDSLINQDGAWDPEWEDQDQVDIADLLDSKMVNQSAQEELQQYMPDVCSQPISLPAI